jgi:hypothetical protein
VASINNGPLAGMRNAIINGNFDIWQRGTSQTAVGYGSADRWAMQRTGSTCTMSREAFALGQTAVPGEPTYFCRMAVTSVAGASNRVLLGQNIEGVRAFAGQQITVSFWAKADATKNIAINHFQSFGTGGSPSTAVGQLGVSKTSLTTSWQRITHTFAVPSISGKSLGSDNNDSLGFEIYLDAGSTFNASTDTLGQQSGTFDIAQVQVEPGPIATTFERRPIGTELSLCQRYFCKSYNTNVNPGTIAEAGKYEVSSPVGGGTLSIGTTAVFPSTMRGVPTVTAYNPSTGTSNSIRRDTVNVTPTIQNAGEKTVSIRSSSGTSATSIAFHYAADAEL